MAFDFSTTIGAYVSGDLASPLTDGDWTVAYWLKAHDAGSASRTVALKSGGVLALYADLNFNDWRANYDTLTQAVLRTENGSGFVGVWKLVIFEYDATNKTIDCWEGDETTPTALLSGERIYSNQVGVGPLQVSTPIVDLYIGAQSDQDTVLSPIAMEHVLIANRKLSYNEKELLRGGVEIIGPDILAMVPLRDDDSMTVGLDPTSTGTTVVPGPNYPALPGTLGSTFQLKTPSGPVSLVTPVDKISIQQSQVEGLEDALANAGGGDDGGTTNPLLMPGNQVKLVYMASGSAGAGWYLPDSTSPDLSGRLASITWEGDASQIPPQGTGDDDFQVGDTALIRTTSL